MILLDTCALLWLTNEPGRLSAPAVAAIESNVGALSVSAFSAFEIGIKASKGRLHLFPLGGEQLVRTFHCLPGQSVYRP